jgi:hypothetical protein
MLPQRGEHAKLCRAAVAGIGSEAEKFWSEWRRIEKIGRFSGMGAVMEWVVKLEARNGWGEVETIEVGRLQRRVVGLTEEEVG